MQANACYFFVNKLRRLFSNINSFLLNLCESGIDSMSAQFSDFVSST